MKESDIAGSTVAVKAGTEETDDMYRTTGSKLYALTSHQKEVLSNLIPRELMMNGLDFTEETIENMTCCSR